MKTIFTYNFFKIFIYFLFVFSGLVKWIPMPMDITALSLAICIIIMVFEVRKFLPINKMILLNVSLIFILIVFFYISNFYTISIVYAEKKNTAMVLNFFAALYPFIVFKKDFFKELKVLMYVVGIIMIGILFYLFVNDMFIIFFDSAKALENVPTYLSIGIMLSSCILFSFADRVSIWLIVYRLTLLFLLLQLGGRGPIINLVLAIIVFYLIHLKNIKLTYKSVFALVVLLTAAIYFLPAMTAYLVENVNVDRFNLQKASTEDGSILYRIEAMRKGLTAFAENPFFGLGIGSSGLSIMGTDTPDFPHNLMIESLMELGFFGGVIYLLINALIFIGNIKLVRNNKNLLILYTVAFLFFMEDNKSGSFDSWRISIFWMVLFLAAKNIKIQYDKHRTQKAISL